MGTSSGEKRKRKRGTQARGETRREQLLDAAVELLSDSAPEDISISDIAGQAGIPVASTYHFYANPAAVYAALATRFAEELDTCLAQPYTGAEAESWQSMIETAVARATAMYADRPDYRRLILGGTAPAEVKLADRQNDETIGQIMIREISEHFELPDFPRRTEIFFHAVEMSDLLMTLSQIKYGEITPAMSREAARAMVAYLRTYLPEILPRTSGDDTPQR